MVQFIEHSLCERQTQQSYLIFLYSDFVIHYISAFLHVSHQQGFTGI